MRMKLLLVVVCGLVSFGMCAPRVRRELRSLSENEREKVFKALNVMKEIKTDIGKVRFNNTLYISYDELTAKHLKAAIDLRCDQAHLGPAFATFHRIFTLQFEESLLAVEPTIGDMPYWDYNVEAGLEDPRTSELWSWFGSSEGDSTRANAVLDGRFGHWRVPPGPSPFGLLRSPWNNNPSPHLTRHPLSCGSTTTFQPALWGLCLRAPQYLTWYACIDPTVHTWAHSFLGGIWNANTLSRIPCFLENSVAIPEFWKHGCLQCPASPCSADTDVADCTCNSSKSPSCLLDRAVPDKAPTYGDFADAWTSPNDPIFFFHHANVDRNLMTWQQLHREAAPSYGLPKTHLPCYGHGLDDVISSAWPFEGELVGMSAAKNLTNADIIRLDGLGNDTIYTYDTLV